MKLKLAGVIVAAFTVVTPTKATIIAYTDSAGQGRLDCALCNFALTFDVNSPIIVSELGLFNASGSGVINGPVQVVQVTPTVTFSGSYTPVGLGYDVFQAITPVILGPGAYLVDEWGLNANGDLSGNLAHGSTGPVLNDGGGLLTFTGATYDVSNSFDNPFGNGCSGC